MHSPLRGAQQSPRGAESCTSRASLGYWVPPAPPGLPASTSPRDTRACPRRASRGRRLWPKLCSLTVFFLATIFSSFLAILSSSSSWPMLAHDARRGEGRRDSSRASGTGGAEAEGVQPARAANTHHTHTPGEGGAPPPGSPLARLPPTWGEGWRALNIDFKDSPGQRLPAPAGPASGEGQGGQRGPLSLGLSRGAGGRRDIRLAGLSGERGRTLSRTREAAAARKAPEGAPGAPGRVQGSRVSALLQLKADARSSVPVPKSEATWCTRITFLGAIIKYTSALPCALSCARVSKPSVSVYVVYREILHF